MIRLEWLVACLDILSGLRVSPAFCLTLLGDLDVLSFWQVLRRRKGIPLRRLDWSGLKFGDAHGEQVVLLFRCLRAPLLFLRDRLWNRLFLERFVVG